MGEKPSFVIITGLSGAGKSYAIKCFEDMGYFCVDNLPTTLIPTFAALCAQSTREIRRIALGVDVREREYLAHLVETLQELKQRGYPTEGGSPPGGCVPARGGPAPPPAATRSPAGGTRSRRTAMPSTGSGPSGRRWP